MSQIAVHRSHGLTLAEVKRRAEVIAARLRDEYGGSYAWAGSTLSFKSTGATGQLTVTKDHFEVRVDLSFLLGAFHSRIEREIHAFCDEQLGAGEARARVPARPSGRRKRATAPPRPGPAIER